MASDNEVRDVDQPRRERQCPIPILTISELRMFGDAEWLVDDVLPRAGFAGVVAPQDSLKSFFVLDIACCVASAKCDWKGRATLHGSILYIVAEGGRAAAYKRIQAWCKHHHVEEVELDPRLFVVPVSVDILNARVVQDIVAWFAGRGIRPVLIVIDTLARCIGAGDENDSHDMNAFVAGCDALRFATDATVVVVHHMGRSRDNPRGSSVFDAALDVLIVIEREGDLLTLTCRKQKDAEAFAPIRLRREVIDLGLNARGKRISSCVLVPHVSESRTPVSQPTEHPRLIELCEALDTRSEADGCKSTELLRALSWTEPTFYRWLKLAKMRGYVESIGTATPELVRLRQAGRELAVSRVSVGLKPSHETPSNSGLKSQRQSAPKGRGGARQTGAPTQGDGAQPRKSVEAA